MFAQFIMKAYAASFTVNPNLPGFNPPSNAAQGPASFVQSFYSFALLISGVLAFGVIVWGGVKYAASRGNPSSQSDAKTWITGALLGLLLLGGAYIILKTVNPDIINLQLPALPGLTTPGSVGNTGGGTCGPAYGTCPDPSTQTCSQNSGGVWGCITNGGLGGSSSGSSNPACQGVVAGCTVWTLNQPVSASCQGFGSKWNSCTNGSPPSGQSCFTQTQC